MTAYRIEVRNPKTGAWVDNREPPHDTMTAAIISAELWYPLCETRVIPVQK